jgi:hypothetical protein
MNRPLLLLFLLLPLLTACSTSRSAESGVTGYVPPAPDYADTTMWYVVRNDAGQGADVFYIPSTWEFDRQMPDGSVSHYADTSLPRHRADMRIEMSGVAEYMADGNNFYSPYYRHITLDTWATLDEDTIARRYRPVSFRDVERAFTYYLRHYNGGRPFVLAGFSQGGKSVVELLKALPARARRRLVAAYVLGYKVTPADTVAAPWLVAARGADDTGVIVCYNTVSDVRYTKAVVSAPNVMGINPVNWRTDATPAVLHDTLTVALDTAHHVLVLDGYDGSALPNILNVLNVGDYHGVEPWLYSDCLRENIRRRIAAFRQQDGGNRRWRRGRER